VRTESDGRRRVDWPVIRLAFELRWATLKRRLEQVWRNEAIVSARGFYLLRKLQRDVPVYEWLP
jgi:hypothetical protein